MKKISLFLSMIAVIILAACSGGESSGGSDSSEKADGEKTKIEYWHVNADTQGGQTVEELVKAFNEQSDTVEVTARYNPDMYQGLMSNLQREVTAGKSPAVVQIGWAFLDYFGSNFEYVSPVELIEKHETENPEFLEDNYLPNILDLAKNPDGEQVGFPYSLSTPVLYLNKELLKEAGLSEEGPKTWEEVEEFAKVIKDETGKYGLYIQEPADFWAQQTLIESNGARLIEDGEAKFASDKGVEAFELYNKMVVDDESALHIGWDQGIQSFINGEVGMLFTTIAQRNNVQSNSQFDLTAVEAPVFEGEERRLPAGGAMLAVTAQSDDEQQAAWEFIKFLLSTEGVTEWTKGTGYVPPVVGVAEDENGLKPFLDENEMMKPAINQMESVVPWASFPGSNSLEIEQQLQNMRDEVLSGDVDVEQKMKETEDKVNSLLE